MISVISLNWNTTDLIINLFNSIMKLSKDKKEIIIVDNGSQQDEFDRLLKYFYNYSDVLNVEGQRNEYFFEIENNKKTTKLKLIQLPENIGFAAGNNYALQYLNNNTSYVYFINSDILISESNWDEKFEDIFLDKRVGVVGCAYHPLKWDRLGNFHIQPIPTNPVISETVQGAFFGISKRVIDETISVDDHLFDENFKFAHYEETDLQIRIIKRGYKTYWVPINHQHFHNQSATKKNGYNLCEDIKNINDFKNNSQRNKQLLIKKHNEYFQNK